MTDESGGVVGADASAARESGSMDLLDVLVLLASRWRLLVFGPLIAGALAVAGSFLVRQTFTAEAVLLPPVQSQGPLASLSGALGGGAASLVGAALPGLKDPNDQWIAMLRSRTVADALVDRFDLVALYGTHFRFEARKKLAERTRVTVTRQGMISVEVDDHDPQRARDLARGYVEELQKLANVVAVGAARARREFFERQLALASQRLGQAEAELRSVGVQSDVLKTSPQATVEAVAEVQRNILALEVQMSSLRSTFTEASPQMLQAQARLDQLRRRLATLQSSQPAGAGAADGSYVAKFRAFKYAEVVFEGIARQLELARLEEAREGAQVQALDLPQVPEWKSRPKRAVVGLATFLGTAMLLLLWVMLTHQWARALQRPHDARRLHALKRYLRWPR